VTTASAPAGVATEGLQQAIEIEPVNPDVYYVPIYNPAVAFGAWSYPDYPPFYWSPPGFVASNIVSFASGVAVGAAIWGGCDWWNHNVIINVNRFNAFNRTNVNVANNIWTHNPAHRGDVPYRNAAVAERFGRDNTTAMRDELRDRLNAERPSEVRPNEQRLMEGERDLKNDAAPTAPERREADVGRDDVRRDMGERLERREAAPGPHFDRPRVGEGEDLLRRRSIESFRPRAHNFGGFRERFGGMRRL